MRTRDDKSFCNLLACQSNVGIKKLPYLAYLMQISGFDLRYHYSIRLDTIKSHGLISSLGDLVSMGYATQGYELTEAGEQELSTYCITNEEDTLCDKIMFYVSELSHSQLYLICVTDMMLQDSLRRGGYKSLQNDRENIEDTVKGLCSAYTPDDFNTAVGILRELRKGGDL